CFAPATLHDFGEAVERLAHGGRRHVTQSQMDRRGFSCTHIDLIVGGSFCPRVLWIDGILFSVNYVVVDPVFDIATGVGRAQYPLVVCLILGEEQRDVSLTVKVPLAYEGM